MPYIGASAQVTLLDPAHFIVFSLEDASTPGTSIESQAPAKPYGNPIQVTFLFPCVQDHVYTVKVWESVDSTPTGVVRCSYSVTVTTNSVLVRLPIYAEVDITAGWVSGTDTVVDSSLAGWDYILRRDPDYLIPDTAIPGGTSTNTYTKNTDGFTLLNGILFQPNEQWIIEFIPQVVAAAAGIPSSPYGSGRIITASETLAAVDKNKALLLQSATNKIVIDLPSLSSLTDFTDVIYLMSNGGNHINAVIKTQGTDKIQYAGTTAELVLGQTEFVGLFKAFGYFWPICDLPGVRMVGELLYNYSTGELNTILCDGSVLNRADYPRLWSFVQGLSAGVIAEASWGLFTTIDGLTVYPNKGKFSTGNGTTTFRLPLLTDTMLKGVDGSTRLPASFENHALVDHQHEETIGLLGTSLFGQATTTRVKGNYGAAASGTDDLTSKPTNSTGGLITAIGSENKVKNIGAYLLIRI